MGDHLEQFIMENKASFESEEPSGMVWKRIDKRMRRTNSFFQTAWKVAAVIFMVSTIYLLIEKTTSETNFGPQLSEEFREAEDYYVQLINLRKEEIQAQLSPEQNAELLTEIDQLDNLYIELKKTYQTNAANDRVIDAMINNLQLRLDILNKQLEILEKIKGEKNESESTNEI